MRIIYNDKTLAARSRLKQEALKQVLTAKNDKSESLKLDFNKDEAIHIDAVYQELVLSGFIASKNGNSITVDFIATKEADKSPFEFEY